MHIPVPCHKCARFHSIVKTPSASFLCTDPLSSTQVAARTWSMILQRHLDLPLYNDDIDDLLWAHRQEPIDPRGDHALICRHGFGVVRRHNSLPNDIARSVIKRAGLRFTLGNPFLVEGRSFRSADIFAQPAAPGPGGTPGKPTA